MTSENQKLTHLDAEGRATMVDVGDKPITDRRAEARAHVVMAPATLAAITADQLPKGDVFAVARIAGIQGAKRCSDLIPLCHPLPLSSVEVVLQADHTLPGVVITARCRVTGQTGIEMEALTAASVAALTVYDMCKAIDRGMSIEAVQLVTKTGGVSGDWERESSC